MNGHRFFIVDVFGEEKYSGNQLAVVLPQSRITDAGMQKIAREFNFPETTFITHPQKRNGGFDVRIFTPGREVPFAGHPTLGTAYVIRNILAKTKAREIILNLRIGPIHVRFETGESGLVWMKQNAPAFGRKHEAKPVAKVIGLSAANVDSRFPIQEVSTGMKFLMVPLKNLAAVRKARTDMTAFRKYFGATSQDQTGQPATGGLPIFLFSPETYSRDNQINCRMFADIFGIPEDPATGSANGCLAGYLVKHGYFQSRKIDVRVEQGYEMGRRSLIHLAAEAKGRLIQVQVGGKVFEVAEGRLR